MLAQLQAHLHAWLYGAGMLIVLGALIKSVPKLVEDKVKAALAALFASGDPADKAWMVATCVWAEAKYGPASGAAKAQAVVDKILGLLPLQYRLFVSDKSRENAVALFQQSFDRVMAAAHEAETKHGAANGPA